jgi:hypothetical protein
MCEENEKFKYYKVCNVREHVFMNGSRRKGGNTEENVVDYLVYPYTRTYNNV